MAQVRTRDKARHRHVCCSPWICLTTLYLVLNGTLLLGTIWANYKLISEDLEHQEHEFMSLIDKEKAKLLSQEHALLSLFDEEKALDSHEGDSPQQFSATKYHLIFSTGCHQKQHWQSFVFFHSVITSGQEGDVTRIASGCNYEQMQELKKIHEEQIQPMGRKEYDRKYGTYSDKIPASEPSRFHLHITPDFGHDAFHYLNKPYGVAHWMEIVLGYKPNNRRTIHDDTIVILFDPDMVLMRPFVNNDFSDEKEIWRPRSTFAYKMKVEHGYPMAAEYGYSDLWYRKTNLTQVISPDEMPSPMQSMSAKVIEQNFAAGPPYMATARDFYAIVDKWREFSKPVHDQNPASILTEMYAYSLAAAHLNLPHQLARSFMISDRNEQAFDLVRSSHGYTASEVCRNVPMESKPHVLHYCHRYSIGKYVMGKHRLPETFVGHPDSCKSPLLAEPPDAAPRIFNFYIDPDTHKKYAFTASKSTGRSAQDSINEMTFLLCQELIALNQAAIYYKRQHCSNPNIEKTLIFHHSLELTEEEKAAVAIED